MSARCRPGDLAVVVGATSTPLLVGCFVIIERAGGPHGERFPDGQFYLPPEPGQPEWVCRSAATGAMLPIQWMNSATIQYVERRIILDRLLLPIRPNEGEDESLSWTLPAPSKTREVA